MGTLHVSRMTMASQENLWRHWTLPINKVVTKTRQVGTVVIYI
jgi:hypothetical protein